MTAGTNSHASISRRGADLYWVEQSPVHHPQVDARIKAPGVRLVSSHLALLECLVLPLRRGQTGLQQEYELFFASQLTDIVGFSEVVFRNAAEIRASHKYHTPDALHLAAALDAACDVFLTNDVQLKSFTQITVEVIT